MKKLGILVMAMVLVFGMSLATMAFNADGSGDLSEGDVSASVGATLEYPEYVEIDMPDAIDLGEIDLSDNYGSTNLSFPFEIRTTTDVDIQLSADEFDDEKLNDFVGFRVPFYAGWTSPGGSTSWYTLLWEVSNDYNSKFDENGIGESEIRMTFNHYGANEDVTEDNFYKVRSGEHSTTVTVTVSATN